MKPMATINTSEVVRYTAKNMLINHSDMLTSTAKAIELETMKKRMMRGECVRFAYLKKDGSIRIAVGTLQANAVQSNTAGTGLPKRFYGMFAYLDIEKMSWRGFKEENFIGTIEN
jgi:hypothetical protein